MASEADIDALIASTPAAPKPSEADIDALIAQAHAEPSLMGGLEAAKHGAGDAIPFGNKLQAGMAAIGQGAVNLLPKGFAKRHDLAQAPASEAYDYALNAERGNLAKAQKDQKWATRGGELVGGGLSMAALAPLKVGQGASLLARLGAAGGNAATYGALHGAGEGDSLGDAARRAAIEAPISGALGSAGAAAAEFAGPAARALGGRAKDVAGWLKVNSIHPTPKLGETMADLPGGVSGIGKELLARNIGGLTKHGTAEQIESALKSAGPAMRNQALAYDAAGSAPLDIGEALDTAGQYAGKLVDEPTRKSAGQQLQGLLSDYAEKYGAGEEAPLSAEEALTLKRALADEAYGARDQLAKSGNKSMGDYGKGVARLERGVDSTLDRALGPKFEQSNLTFRRLMGARDAAERAAARTTANHALGLIPVAAGAAGASLGHGTPGMLATGLGSLLLSKYGAQAGARTLYGLGRGLELAPELAASAAQKFPQAASLFERAPALAAPEASGLAGQYAPGFANSSDDIRKRLMLANILRGGP